MRLRAKIIIFSILALLCAYIILGTAFLMRGWSVYVCAALYAAGSAGIAAGILFLAIKKDALLKTTLVLEAAVALVLTVVIIINAAAHLNELETDGDKIAAVTDLILSAGGWSMAVYVVIQILQVVILPLPAVVCYVPGALIWEPWVATLLASAGVLIGALICYFLGRVFGRRVVEWIAGKENTDKYADYLGKRGKVLFVMMQILPFFPDDILCLVAGLTKMNFPFFLITMIIVRPAIVATYCYLGSGTVIPFSGWGIPVWIAIAAVCVVLAVLSFKYEDKIESFLKKLVLKMRRGTSAESVETDDSQGENNDAV